MTADIINLRRAKKAKPRREKVKRTEENRALFGLARTERNRTRYNNLRLKRELDGARREAPAGKDTSSDATTKTPHSAELGGES
jgi:hypothetical protein